MLFVRGDALTPLRIAALALAALVAAGAGRMATPSLDWTPQEGTTLLGKAAREWRGLRWIQGGPTTLAALRGKVVLLRFWLVGCAYCTRSAPALRELWQQHKDQGLVVVGVHHPKSPESQDLATVARGARALRFEFPIATDADWSTLRAYGIGRVFQRFTSVSFVIDRAGVIQFVHDGGEFHRGGGAEHATCNAAFEALEAAIVAALEDDPQASSKPAIQPR